MQTTIPIGKLIKKTLVEQAVEQVQAYILVQKLTPGDVLPSEMRFTEILGVSRPVVREALRTLAGRGVLTIANGRNAVVSPVSATMLIQFFERATQLNGVAVVELLEVRLGIEVQSAMLAASRRTASDITALRDAIVQRERPLTIPAQLQQTAVRVRRRTADRARGHHITNAHVTARHRVMGELLRHAPVHRARRKRHR